MGLYTIYYAIFELGSTLSAICAPLSLSLTPSLRPSQQLLTSIYFKRFYKQAKKKNSFLCSFSFFPCCLHRKCQFTSGRSRPLRPLHGFAKFENFQAGLLNGSRGGRERERRRGREIGSCFLCRASAVALSLSLSVPLCRTADILYAFRATSPNLPFLVEAHKFAQTTRHSAATWSKLIRRLAAGNGAH